MSYTEAVKTEISSLSFSDCCKKSEIYGLLFFSTAFRRKKINLSTESLECAQLFEKRIGQVFGTAVKTAIKDSFGRSKTYELSIPKNDIARIFNGLSYIEKTPEQTLIRSVFDRRCCFPAFLRGAFLSCGSMQNPEIGYRIDFAFSSQEKCKILKTILEENGIVALEGKRQGYFILYFKDSVMIEDFLTFIGATNASLSLMNEKILKDIRNNTNRKINCDSANISKTLDAVSKQISAIQKIETLKGLSFLPDELEEVARLRLLHRDVPLSELCTMTNKTLSKSGLNHRLQKIIKISDELK